jgi:Ca2+-binding RTX toxin-like protein
VSDRAKTALVSKWTKNRWRSQVRRIANRTVLLLSVMAVALVMAGGIALAAAVTQKQCELGSDFSDPCHGTKGDDEITGTSSWDVIKGRAGNDIIRGRDGIDFLFGNADNDTLIEGSNPATFGGPPILCGGVGNDTLKGKTGTDLYAFGKGWGRDTIKGEEDSSDSDVVDFTGCSFDAASLASTNLTIDLSSGKAFETDEGENGANSVSWTPEVIESASGGSGNDTINGSSHVNELAGFDGDDNINAMDSSDGDADFVDCGEGDDVAQLDVSDDSSGCETRFQD